MAHVREDRVYETTGTTGTGSYTLTGAVDASFVTYASVMADGDTCRAVAVDDIGHAWETGLYTWNTGNTLSRTTIEGGSNGTSAVSFANAPKIFIAAIAGDFSGSYYLNNTLQAGRAHALPRTDIFTSSGTWTRETGASRVNGWIVAAGGGGGGGASASDAAAYVPCGGGGGGGGSYLPFDLTASDAGASASVTIGAPGTGGAGATADPGFGSNGADGAPTSIAFASGTLAAQAGSGASGGAYDGAGISGFVSVVSANGAGQPGADLSYIVMSYAYCGCNGGYASNFGPVDPGQGPGGGTGGGAGGATTLAADLAPDTNGSNGGFAWGGSTLAPTDVAGTPSAAPYMPGGSSGGGSASNTGAGNPGPASGDCYGAGGAGGGAGVAGGGDGAEGGPSVAVIIQG